MLVRSSCAVAALVLLPSAVSFAQQNGARTLTTQDYANAERWMGYNVGGLVHHTIGGIQYLPDGRVFYRDPGTDRVAYMIADPATKASALAFDNSKISLALRDDKGLVPDEKRLAVSSYKPDAAGSGFTVSTRIGDVHCASATGECARSAPATRRGGNRPAQPQQTPNGQPPAGRSATETGGNSQLNAGGKTTVPTPAPPRPVGRTRAPFDTSPDKKYQAFIRDHNLWVRTTESGEEKQLTTDGVQDYGYATDNAGWQHSDAPILLWSPDSRKIATFQQDQRKTGSMYLVPVTNRHPVLEAWKYPLVGDADVTMIERVVIDVASGKVTRLKMPADQHRSSLCDDVSCRGGAGWDDVEFSPDGATIAFLSTGRDHKDEWLKIADTETGEVHEVFHEHVPTYYESGQGRVNWHYLPKSDEFLWYSERSDYGQMYLYDLKTGKLKNQITHGDGPVTQVLHVDEKNRVLYFLATGKEKGADPYFTHYYRVDFDGQHQQLLTSENADHAVTPSSDASTFVDVYSTNETPQTAVLRDNTGKVLLSLGQQDTTALTATGWKPREAITVKARDGKTPLYGFLWKPTNFDAAKKYPLVDYVYPGPQEGSCHGRGFAAASGDNQALADLGFVVICIDGMGTPLRSKSFHDAHASKPEEMGEDTIPDQAAGIKELAARYPWIDLDRVGIWGHSGGGNATVSAMFHFPELFKVGIAESGNHDNRDYEDDWDERWAGVEKKNADGTSNYDVQANQNYAKNLKGKLMLAHGTMDDNVPPSNTLLVVDALIKANKDFDLIMIPNAHHGYGEAQQYMMRRRWDYFVRNLAGNVPPVNYQTKTYEEALRLMYANGPSDDSVDGDLE